MYRHPPCERPAPLLDPEIFGQVAALQHRGRSVQLPTSWGGRAEGPDGAIATGLTAIEGGSGRASSAGTFASPLWSQHATSLPEPFSGASCGTSWRHRSMAHVQRGLNAHPWGSALRSGGDPGIPSIRERLPCIGGKQWMRPCVYGSRGALNSA